MLSKFYFLYHFVFKENYITVLVICLQHLCRVIYTLIMHASIGLLLFGTLRCL